MKKGSLFLSVFLWSVNCWALEVQISPNPIMQGESTELVIRSDKPINIPENLQELTQNFMLAGQQQRQSSQFVNGVGSTNYELAFVLFPLRQGDLEIPPLKIGPEKTLSTVVKVLPKGQASNEAKDLPMLEMSADVSDTKPYIGQTIFYTLTLTDGQGILDGEIIPAKTENVRLSQVGQDKANSVLKKGQRVHEITRTYTLTLEQAGKIEIPPALFNGQVAYQAPRSGNKKKFFGIADADMLFGNFFDSSRPISLTSNPVTIDVQPKPANSSGWWLPASKVELKSDYQIPEIVQIGDTLSGKFTLIAQDVNANDMPVPRIIESKNFRVYPQPEERSTTIVNGHLQGRVTVSFMLIPLKAGTIEIPKVSVNWFNTVTKKAETASIPAYPLTVEQGGIKPIIGINQHPLKTSDTIADTESPSNTKSYTWLWIMLGTFLGLLIGIGVMAFLYHKKTQTKDKKRKPLPDFYAFK